MEIKHLLISMFPKINKINQLNMIENTHSSKIIYIITFEKKLIYYF